MKKILVLLVVLITGAVHAHAADPILFYSDLVSGPKSGWQGSGTKGAAVTVWGLNLGALRGNSYLSIGGQNLTAAQHYAEWGAKDNNPKMNPQVKLERITFWLNSSMQSGQTKISATVNGVSSNKLDFRVKELGNNHIYFIDDSGSDSNNGRFASSQGGSSGPWKTFGKADPEENSSVLPGDIIYIRSGTYNIQDGDGALIKSYGGGDGAPGAPIAFVGYPGDNYPNCTIKLLYCAWPQDSGGQLDHWVFSKLKYTGPQTGVMQWYGDDWRVIGLYFDMTQPTRQFKSGTLVPWDAENIYMMGLTFIGGGYDYYAHHIYPVCTTGSNRGGNIRNLHIAFCEIDDMEGNRTPGSYGGAAFNFRKVAQANTIEDVYIHNNYMHDSDYGQFFYANENGGCSKFYLYNNLITNSNGHGSASARAMFFAGFGNNNGQFYAANNTIVEGGGAGYVFQGYNSADWHLEKNIVVESTGTMYIATQGSEVFSNWDMFSGSGNLLDGSLYHVTNRIADEPNFNSDFSLANGSAGMDAVEYNANDFVKMDLLGVSRPQAGLVDLGAYENAGSSPTPGGNEVDPVISLPKNHFDANMTNYASFEVKGVGEAGELVEISDNTGTVVGSAVVQQDNNWSVVTDLSDAEEGEITIQANIADKSSNVVTGLLTKRFNCNPPRNVRVVGSN